MKQRVKLLLKLLSLKTCVGIKKVSTQTFPKFLLEGINLKMWINSNSLLAKISDTSGYTSPVLHPSYREISGMVHKLKK